MVDSLDLGSNARACRFESCHPHQLIKGGICLPLLIDQKYGTRTHPNATVRWTVAEIRLDGFYSIHFRKAEMAIESCHPHQGKKHPAGCFFVWQNKVSNPFLLQNDRKTHSICELCARSSVKIFDFQTKTLLKFPAFPAIMYGVTTGIVGELGKCFR